MGKVKNQIVEEQDRADALIEQVAESGGDRMTSTATFLEQLDALLAQGVPCPHSGSEDEIEADALADAEAQRIAEGAAAVADAQERAEYRESASPDSEPPPPSGEAAPSGFVSVETPAEKARRLELSKPIVGVVSTEKLVHGQMVLNGVCTNCVCCGMPLTDAISVERGQGPVCSTKGYAEDPKNPDEIQALIELSEYPALVEFLTEHYKPHGARGLMNGLVRIACLNRKSPVHAACANAIEALGYKNLANKVRDALTMMVVKKSQRPGHLHVWVRRSEWTRQWQQDCYSKIPHCTFDRAEKGLLVPDRLECKKELWRLMKVHFAGLCAKTPTGTVKIPKLDG